MPIFNKHNKRTAIILVSLILFAAFLRYMWRYLPSNNLRGFIYMGIFAAWGISVRRRIIQVQVRRYLTAISSLMVFWVAIRSLKYSLDSDLNIIRYCWYSYYFPMLFIPLLTLLVALSLGKPDNFRLPKLASLIFLISAALLAMVMTNDFHQLVFGYPKGLQFIDNNDYTHEIGYYLSVGWMALCAISALAVMRVKCRLPGSKKRIWLPWVPVFALIVYAILYVTAWDYIKLFAGDMTVVSCLLVTATLDSCIQCGLIQSNTHYNELFSGCGISAVIVDNDYDLQYSTAVAMNLPREQMRLAEQNAIEIDDSMILKSMPLSDGHILWLEDVSELRRLQHDLESNTVLLSEETELLAEEVQQKEEKATTDTRNRLYDTVAHEIAPQIEEINRLIADRSSDMEIRKKALKRMCVLGAYVKRRCNLIFLNEQQTVISSMELYHCLQESSEYILQYGIPCSVDSISQSNVTIENAKLAYDFFEYIVENTLDKLTAVAVRIIASENELVLKLMAEGVAVDLKSADLLQRIELVGGRTEIDYEDGVWYCTLTLSDGGGA